ncbi:DUF6075 family protein [Enterococcus sp. AZ196]|uniref:DUF6075 family protein n=1 Tax=Enterococcus sp. AZ196 TaxID=2774659 RepID=UPI003D27BA8D
MNNVYAYSMRSYVFNDDHLDKWVYLMEEMGFSDFRDSEWRTVLYLIAADERLYRDRKTLINFEEKSINADKWFKNSYSSGENKLLALAFNLYTQSEYYEYPNGERIYITPMDIFTSLDSEYRWVAIEAIKVRFLRE